jgi:hypothetical protein
MLASFFLDQIQEGEEIGIEPLLILAESSVKALQIFAEEVGSEAGEYRSAYLRNALEAIADSTRRALHAERDGMEHLT